MNETITEYKNNPILQLNPDEKFPFGFGLGKAKLILEHLDAIKAFVESGGKSTNLTGEPLSNFNCIFKAKDRIENKLTGDKGIVKLVDEMGFSYFNHHGKMIFVPIDEEENFKLDENDNKSKTE